MSVFSYTTTNVQFSTFDVWSNAGFTANTNINLSNVLTDAHPAESAPNSVSEIYNTSWLYGAVTVETGGTAQVTSPYTGASIAAGSSQTLKNVNLGLSNCTITATATYPYPFHSFRDASGGGGTALSTSGQGTGTGTITLTSANHTGVGTFYVYFTTTHISP